MARPAFSALPLPTRFVSLALTRLPSLTRGADARAQDVEPATPPRAKPFSLHDVRYAVYLDAFTRGAWEAAGRGDSC
jgi:hypothetical protein